MSVCISGDECTHEAVESTAFPGIFKFCEAHQALLDRFRDDMNQSAFEKSSRNKKKATVVKCANGCDARPIYGTIYCAECEGE